MSITNPKNLTELKEYLKTRLGAPVLEINVSDEQMDVAINDGFAYYYGRSHYNGTERVYLGLKVEQPFLDFFDTKKQVDVTQSTEPLVYGDGFVDTVTLTAAGSGYPIQSGGGSGTQISVATTATSGSGEGLTVNLNSARTTQQGLVGVTVNQTGSGYAVGDTFTVNGYNGSTGTPATFEVATIKTSSAINSTQTFEFQNNYIVLPESVLSVSQVMKSRGFGGFGRAAGIPGVALFNPFLAGGGGMGMGACGSMGYDMTTYYTMRQYLATLEFMMFPPISYNFNQRTKRLYLNTDSFNGVGVDDYLIFEVTTYPDPVQFRQMYSDFWLKEYWVALVKYQWGQNLTKYSGVQLPGGITLNGDGIKNEAKQELEQMRSRFSMDAADPPLDLVG